MDVTGAWDPKYSHQVRRIIIPLGEAARSRYKATKSSNNSYQQLYLQIVYSSESIIMICSCEVRAFIKFSKKSKTLSSLFNT
jgi:hypothetical protein